jgi:hypothetical protein
MSIVGKLYNKLLLSRIQPHLNKLLRGNQNGFRGNRGTSEQILALRRLIEGLTTKGGDGVFTFIDFKKAFDSISRARMMKILRAYGVAEKVVSQINAMYEDTIAAVRTEDGTSEYFSIETGVLQGDTLAPFLFVIMIDYVMTSALRDLEEKGISVGVTLEPKKRGTRRTGDSPAVKLCDLDFADDIVLCTDNIVDNQLFLSAVELCAEEIGLFINKNKTEFIVVGKAVQNGLSILSGPIKQVEDFKYLGSFIMNSKKDISVRVGIAWTSLKKLNCVWKSQLEKKEKMKIFTSLVQSILLYSCETWSLTKTLEKKIDGARNRMLRYALNISWKDHIPNSVVLEGIVPISDVIRERRVRFAGHCLRAKDQPVSRVVLWEGIGPGRRGNFKTYPKILREDLLKLNIGEALETEHIMELALNRRF